MDSLHFIHEGAAQKGMFQGKLPLPMTMYPLPMLYGSYLSSNAVHRCNALSAPGKLHFLRGGTTMLLVGEQVFSMVWSGSWEHLVFRGYLSMLLVLSASSQCRDEKWLDTFIFLCCLLSGSERFKTPHFCLWKHCED